MEPTVAKPQGVVQWKAWVRTLWRAWQSFTMGRIRTQWQRYMRGWWQSYQLAPMAPPNRVFAGMGATTQAQVLLAALA